MNPLLVVKATIARHLGTYTLFILLVAVATAIGVAITAQEAALRTGSARAADKFDLVVAAPGSQTDVVLAAIYLRPGTVPLLDPRIVGKALVEPHAKISAPLGFGDNIRGAPIVGTVALAPLPVTCATRVPPTVLPVKSISAASKPVTAALKTTVNEMGETFVGSACPAD